MSDEQPVRQRARPPEATSQEGVVTVRRTRYEAGEVVDHTEDAERIEVPAFPAGVVPGKAGISGGLTRNLGNMNFAKLDVSVELPCLPEVSEVVRAHDLASEIVHGRLEQELAIAMGRSQEGGTGESPQAQAAERPPEDGSGIRPIFFDVGPDGSG